MNHRQEAQHIPFIYRLIAPFTLIIATAITYYPSLNYDFQFDDIANISKHFSIRSYTFKNLFFSGSRWISYWFNSLYYKLDKFNPLYYRIGNVTIHTINGLLIFFILLAILSRLPYASFFKRNALSLSFLTALIFLLHPVQTQTISYVIQGQLEGLATLFMLGMILCFLHQQYTSNIFVKTVLITTLFTLSILVTGTKEIAIVAPILLILVDWFFIAQGSFQSLKSRWWIHLPIAMFIAGAYVYFLKAKFFADLFSLQLNVENNLGNVITEQYDEKITAFHFFISQFKVILHYIWIYIWPFNLSVEYDWVLSKSLLSPDCIFPFFALAFIGFLIYKLARHHQTSIIVFAALWFIITIAPRSSIMPSPELLVDYKTYPASFGIIFLLATAILKLFEYAKQSSHMLSHLVKRYKVSYAFTILFATILGLGTASRNEVWGSSLEFWGSIIKNAPGKIRAYNNYGVELAQKLGKYAEAIPYYQHAIRMDNKYRDPYNNLAVSYAAIKQTDKAIETLRQSIRIYPLYPEAYNNLASFFIEKKEYEQAERAIGAALQLRPHYGKAHFNLGRIYMETDQPERAWECFKNACMKADLDNEGGFMGYAQSSLLLKKYDDLIFACKKILEYNPNNHDARFNMANAYFMTEQFDQATQVYEQIVRNNPNDAKAWFNLGETHLRAERTTQALECFGRIKHLPGITPNVYLRMAVCYEKQGEIYQAKSMLEELLQKNIPQPARQSVETELQKLVTQYKIS